jgi:ABC-type uncharacterized transport system permease subunit
VKPARGDALLATATGLVGAWLAFNLALFLYGEAPAAVWPVLLRGTWGTAYGAGQVLFKATPLLFTGLAVDVAFRAGLFNIGAEGQLTVASLAVGVVGAALPMGTPALVALPLLTGVAALVGGLWAAIPAWLRVRRGAHEVIGTLMMNGLAGPLVSVAFAYGAAQPGTVRTADVAPGALLPRLSALVPALRGSAASVAIGLAVLAAVLVRFVFERSRVGREVVLVGQNAEACRRVGIPVERRLGAALVAGGALAGLAALGTVLGYKGYYEAGLGAGAGFGGIAVAILGRGNPFGLVLAALLFGTLQQGGLAINGLVPMEIMDVLQGVVIATVAVADARARAAVRTLVRNGRAA